MLIFVIAVSCSGCIELNRETLASTSFFNYNMKISKITYFYTSEGFLTDVFDVEGNLPSIGYFHRQMSLNEYNNFINSMKSSVQTQTTKQNTKTYTKTPTRTVTKTSTPTPQKTQSIITSVKTQMPTTIPTTIAPPAGVNVVVGKSGNDIYIQYTGGSNAVLLDRLEVTILGWGAPLKKETINNPIVNYNYLIENALPQGSGEIKVEAYYSTGTSEYVTTASFVN